MLNYRRIQKLYIKDLLDILRDRRTLIAMIVVPIVLYPLLMLGSIQAATLQAHQLKEQPLVIGVQTERVSAWLEDILRMDAEFVAQKKAQAAAEGVKLKQMDAINRRQIIVVGQVDLQQWVTENEAADCAVMFDIQNLGFPLGTDELRTIYVDVVADSAEIRSAMAGRRVRQAFERYGKNLRDRRDLEAGLPEAYIHPIIVQEIDVATAQKRGGSMLGQIIPLILILMTITGAIYPAIDLTAGERERGTLETLMVCPVPVVEIIIGKFLVVSSVALMGATLNLCSMGLTLQFGGFNQALAAGADTEIPLTVLPLILLFLIPTAVLFSALLLAVCSFARTFKEAQNYVTPVIISALVPAGLAALPGSELQGVMTVMPVGNMVLLTRELLLGNADVGAILLVLLSTCLYAATAVAVAVRVFGQEAVLFADSGSWRAQFDRHMIRPSTHVKPTLALMYVALLFPIWFYISSGLQMRGGDFGDTLTIIQVLMVLCFCLIPMFLAVYYKIDFKNCFSFHWPRPRYLLAGVLMGLSTWAIAYEMTMFQKAYSLFGISDEWLEQLKPFSDALASMSAFKAVVLIAIIPGLCEEILFRGMLLNGLKRTIRRWSAIIAVALVFSAYHYLVQRFVVTFSLGVLLAFLCWQARSVFPAIIAHVMHNGVQILLTTPAHEERFNELLRIPMADDGQLSNLPMHIVLPALLLLMAAIILCLRSEPEPATSTSDDQSRSLIPADSSAAMTQDV